MVKLIKRMDVLKRSRDFKIKKNIFFSFIFKILSVVINFLLVPITLKYLGTELYGVWIVLLSVVSWISIFDIGIGNGLRNKLAISVSNSDLNDAKKYISTAYIIIFLISILISVLIFFIVPLVSWSGFFHTSLIAEIDFVKLMNYYLYTLVLYFILNLINPILNALQLSAFTSISSIVSNVLFISILVYFKSFYIQNLFKIVTLYCICLILGMFVVNVFFYIIKTELLPSLQNFRFTYSKDILKLGGAFFIIQIAALFIFTTDNFLILKFLGPDSVSEYNVIYKLFSIFILGFNMIITPYWTAFTDAHTRKDYKWIVLTLKKLNLIFIPFMIVVLVMNFCYQIILDIWLKNGSDIKPKLVLVIFISVFTIISIWNNVYSYFLNGISNTRIQTQTAIFGALINIPLAYFFINYINLGLVGIVLAMIISLIPFAIIGPIISYKFIKNLDRTNG